MSNIENRLLSRHHRKTPRDIIDEWKLTRDIDIRSVVGRPTSIGSDYFASRSGNGNIAVGEQVFDHASAIALNNKDKIKNFKAVAPLAHPMTAISGDDNITLENKELAPSASEAMDKVAGCLRASHDEKDTEITCGDDDDADAVGVAVDEHADNEMFDPCFYKLRVDFFDNGHVHKKTQYTAKLSIQQHQDHDPSQAAEIFANFYSRGRDFKAFIERLDNWDGWYEAIWDIFQETCDMPLDFRISPRIAILKEREVQNGRSTYEPLQHTACICYQAQGSAPVVTIFYMLWEKALVLDAPFNAKDRKAPYKRGYYVDPERADLEPVKESKGMKVKKRSDFGL